jgi:uncharacterized protein (DUF2141 family)
MLERADKRSTLRQVNEKKLEFETSGLSPGLYFVKIVADDYSETIKLVKTW